MANFLVNQLTRSNSKISQDRAERMSRGVERSYISLINEKKQELDDIDEQIDRMLDMSSSNVTTTKNAIDELNSSKFVEKISELDINRALLVQELEIIKKRRDELLAEEDTEEESS